MYYIYRITNKVNGKTYIGQHKYKDLNDNYMGSGKRLWEAYRKYGFENFEKKILVFNISKREHADLLEKTFIASEREKVGVENCYNLADGGEGGSPNKGKHHSEETKRKISETLKGHTPWNKGKHLKPQSEETKKKRSEALKEKRWFNNGKVCIRAKDCPEGFTPGRLEQTMDRLRNTKGDRAPRGFLRGVTNQPFLRY